MFSRSQASAAADETHPAWCKCRDCAHDWDAAHCGLRHHASTLFSLIIAAAAIGGIALFVGVPA